MTEDEAKTKMCCGPPLVAAITMLANGGQPNGNAHPGNCVASACMAWRWDLKQPSGHGFWGDGTPHAGGNGHCGLAGAPQ